MNIATAGIETVRRFRTRVRDVEYVTLNPGGTGVGPASGIVTSLEQSIEGDSRIKVSGLRNCGSVL